MRALSVAPAAGVGQFAPNSTASVNVTTVNTVKSADQPQPASAKPGILGTLPAKALRSCTTAFRPTRSAPPKHVSGDYLIQVGAFPEKAKPKAGSRSARSKATDVLGHADPFTEKVAKGDKTLYRARFAGLRQGRRPSMPARRCDAAKSPAWF